MDWELMKEEAMKRNLCKRKGAVCALCDPKLRMECAFTTETGRRLIGASMSIKVSPEYTVEESL